ncbi:dihydrofolate reductase family protein [Pseudarthrobacter cellobiosi]|uniref:dihydrofolate reductase family protein n=1 Tax=Pseudarthrobacter cellobiosi TaxID=2953654 RepID=UPI00403F5F9E
MRKRIVQQWVTVDNIAAEEDGGLSFVSGEPFSETTNKAFKASVRGFIDSVDTMILGANTYAQSKDYWPYAEEQGEYGEKLNNLTTFVASSTLDDAPWGDFPAATVTRDPAATIRELKEQSGKDTWLLGELEAHALPSGRGHRRRSPDAGLPGVTRQGNAHLRGSAGPVAGRGHRVRKRRGTSALRDQEISGKSDFLPAMPFPSYGGLHHVPPKRSRRA